MGYSAVAAHACGEGRGAAVPVSHRQPCNTGSSTLASGFVMAAPTIVSPLRHGGLSSTVCCYGSKTQLGRHASTDVPTLCLYHTGGCCNSHGLAGTPPFKGPYVQISWLRHDGSAAIITPLRLHTTALRVLHSSHDLAGVYTTASPQ